ncbi:MAG: formylmethanofuran--tetrahydromethanopterin N-formyltransferase [Methanospirillum sp.]|nr:formylmethanofuran--tetrahydromethanopterin N-formyltransferase [Methanospirillum sp.]
MEYNEVPIDDTYAEAFPAWIARVIITGATREFALAAAVEATGFATSTIGCPCEAGIETYLPGDMTPDGRPGYAILICNPSKKKLKEQLIERIGECVLTAPTTAAFDGIPGADEKIPVKLHFFGDKFESQVKVGDRDCWSIPIMEGDFVVEEEYGTVKGVAGGNFFVMGENQMAALMGAKVAVDAIAEVPGVITPFPGGIVASGSKVGSKYKFMNASTNEAYCPTLREQVPDSKVPENVKSLYEIVIDGVDEEAVRNAMAAGVRAATKIPGVVFISAGNYGGTLGPVQIHLRDLI